MRVGRATTVLLFLLSLTALSGASAQVRVFGHTVDSAGAPISLVLVTVGERSVLTDSDGRFKVVGFFADSALVSFRRVGFSHRTVLVRTPGAGVDGIDLDRVVLHAVPIELSQLTVEALAPIMSDRGIRDFETKKREGFARHFFTAYDIERIKPFDVSQLASRVPGASRRDSSELGTVIRFEHRGGWCIATVVVDGMRTNAHNLDAFVTPDRVGGIIFEPNSCLVSVWTKPFPVGESSPFEIGFHAGAMLGGENGGTGGYVGALLVTPIRENANAMRLHLDVNARVGGEGSRWQALLNLTVRPFGPGSPLYAGMGGGISKRGNVSAGAGGESLAAHHTVLTGLSFDVAFVRPFVEILVLDPLQPGRIAASSRLGMRVLLGS